MIVQFQVGGGGGGGGSMAGGESWTVISTTHCSLIPRVSFDAGTSKLGSKLL